MLRHEQQSIRMALATVMHHSYKVHTENGAPRGQTTATRAGGGTEFYALSEDSDFVGGGGPQERVLQRTVELPVASRRCAADGGTVGGLSCTFRFPCCRASYRGAQDNVSTPRCSHSPPCAADGRTVVGSADGDRIFNGGPCRACPGVEGCHGTGGADREQPSSSGSKGGLRRSSRFRTGFISGGRGADR